MALAKVEASAVARTPMQDTAPLDFVGLVSMGDHLVKTGFLPQHIRTGAQVAAIVMTGRELGMTPMRALRSLVMVKGKVTESADSQLARFKTDGGRAQFKELTDDRAVLWLRHPNGDEHTETFTMADARAAGIATEMYKKYAKAMLRSRAITAGLKSLGWEGGSGVYDPAELSDTPLVGQDASVPEPEPINAPSPAMSWDEAHDIVLKGKKLGEMDRDRLEAIFAWAEEKGNHRIKTACFLLLETMDADASAHAHDVGEEDEAA
jgi:hypothetical protein